MIGRPAFPPIVALRQPLMPQMGPSEWSSGLQMWLAAEGVSEALLKKNLEVTPGERLNRFLECYRSTGAVPKQNFSRSSGMPAEFDPVRLLGVLDEHSVVFVVVGGIAAVLHGSFLITWDLDVLCPDTSENRSRVVATFGVGARSPQPSVRLKFATKLGAVDCEFDSARHRRVSARADTIALAGNNVSVACLDDLIEDKASPVNQDAQVRLWELVELRELVASL